MGDRNARPSCLYKRNNATPHSIGEAQTSCKLLKPRQMVSVSVDMSVTATIGRSVLLVANNTGGLTGLVERCGAKIKRLVVDKTLEAASDRCDEPI
jgi:hypothetical protein